MTLVGWHEDHPCLRPQERGAPLAAAVGVGKPLADAGQLELGVELGDDSLPGPLLVAFSLVQECRQTSAWCRRNPKRWCNLPCPARVGPDYSRTPQTRGDSSHSQRTSCSVPRSAS